MIRTIVISERREKISNFFCLSLSLYVNALFGEAISFIVVFGLDLSFGKNEMEISNICNLN